MEKGKERRMGNEKWEVKRLPRYFIPDVCKLDCRRTCVKKRARKTTKWIVDGVLSTSLCEALFFFSFCFFLCSFARITACTSEASTAASDRKERCVASSWALGLLCCSVWGLCALCHGIQISMEAILACHPVRSTEWLDCYPKLCELMTYSHRPHWVKPSSAMWRLQLS